MPDPAQTTHNMAAGQASSLAEENAAMHAAFELEQTQLVLEHMANALAGPGPR